MESRSCIHKMYTSYEYSFVICANFTASANQTQFVSTLCTLNQKFFVVSLICDKIHIVLESSISTLIIKQTK